MLTSNDRFGKIFMETLLSKLLPEDQKKYFFGKLFFKAEIQAYKFSADKPTYYLLDYKTAKVNSGNGFAFIEENL